MDEHHCLLCMGSNTNRYAQLSVAREALRATFPDIHFGEMMETEAVGSGFHSPFSNQLAKFSTTLSPDSAVSYTHLDVYKRQAMPRCTV